MFVVIVNGIKMERRFLTSKYGQDYDLNQVISSDLEINALNIDELALSDV
jgi:hypothetical protein